MSGSWTPIWREFVPADQKADPAVVAAQALDGLFAGEPEILADELTRTVRARSCRIRRRSPHSDGWDGTLRADRRTDRWQRGDRPRDCSTRTGEGREGHPHGPQSGPARPGSSGGRRLAHCRVRRHRRRGSGDVLRWSGRTDRPRDGHRGWTELPPADGDDAAQVRDALGDHVGWTWRWRAPRLAGCAPAAAWSSWAAPAAGG